MKNRWTVWAGVLAVGFAAPAWAQNDAGYQRELQLEQQREQKNQQLGAAEGEVQKAQKQLDDAKAKVKAKFETTPEFSQAADAAKKAQADYDAAKEPVLKAVHEKPEYQAAQDEVKKAEAQVNGLRDGKASPDVVTTAANAVVEKRKVATKMETDALEADPKVSDAKKQLEEAAAKLAELRKKEDLAMQTDPEYVAAKKQFDDAQSKLTTATKQ